MNGLRQPVTACNARVTAQTSLSVTASVPMRRQAQRSSQRNGTSVVTEMKSRQAAKSVQLARERARPPIGGSNENTFKRRDELVWNSETTGLDGQSASNQRLLERLEAENAQLRGSLVNLMLQIQALRDALGPNQVPSAFLAGDWAPTGGMNVTPFRSDQVGKEGRWCPKNLGQ